MDYIGGGRILDIACGTGYGISIMSGSADFVVGIDIDIEAVRTAAAETGENSAVMIANGLGLPFADGTFDVITSFETLEHLHRRRDFLRELGRVVRPGGRLLLSTPNANYSQPVNGVPKNPFHVHEYTPEELVSELDGFFTIDSFLGQSLDSSAGIPPFYDAQQRLPKDAATQIRLLGWKIFNKIPFGIRETLSDAIRKKPFYPTESDYNFDEDTVSSAPTLLAVCSKR